MAVARQAMTDEQRKSVALEYRKAFDTKGVTSTGGSILDLFADDAQVFFPKWGLATGKAQARHTDADVANYLTRRLVESNGRLTGGTQPVPGR
jgi:hypothetical protein